MTFYFVRHGETEWNVKKKIQGKTDIPLNENGVQQARALAERLVGEQLPAARVYTSPQLRAAATAEILAEALGVECISLPGLREMDMGEWEGFGWDVIVERYGETYYHWDAHRRYTNTPGGESYNEVLGRTLGALGEILAKEKEDVLVVSHSAILMALRCYLAKLPFEEMVTHFKTKNTGIVAIPAEEIREAICRFEKE